MKKCIPRTPKNFDGIQQTCRSLKNLLPSMLLQIDERYLKKAEGIFEAWKSIVGEKMAPFTEVASVEKGVVTVKVKNSTLYSLLCQHEKARLLNELQKKYSKEKIRDLKFRIG